MFLLHEYDIFWTFLIIASLIPILVFWISGLLAPVSEGPEKLSSYESGIEPMGGNKEISPRDGRISSLKSSLVPSAIA